MKFHFQAPHRVREHSTETPQLDYASVQAPPCPSPTASPVSDTGWFSPISQWWATRSEPRITTITDASGQTWWKAYNPRTQELQWLTSEVEVSLWLEAQPSFWVR